MRAINKVSSLSVIMGLIWISIGLLAPYSGLAQDRSDSRWSKSAGTLTIFQPGDAVRIQVWDLYEERSTLNLSNDYPIDPQGNVIMPILGEIKVKGLTVFELKKILEDRLKAYLRNPLVAVQPLIRITLQGAFIRPGAYRVPPSNSLWEAIALSGGPRGDCDLKRLAIERGGKKVIPNLLDSFEKGYSLEDIGVESGDQIVAPAKGFWNLNIFMAFVNLLTSLALLYLRLTGGRY